MICGLLDKNMIKVYLILLLGVLEELVWWFGLALKWFDQTATINTEIVPTGKQFLKSTPFNFLLEKNQSIVSNMASEKVMVKHTEHLDAEISGATQPGLLTLLLTNKSNSLKPVVRSSVRQNHHWAWRALGLRRS